MEPVEHSCWSTEHCYQYSDSSQLGVGVKSGNLGSEILRIAHIVLVLEKHTKKLYDLHIMLIVNRQRHW